MKNLISMTDFVIKQRKEILRKIDYKEKLELYANIIYTYAYFLKQPLELWMFVPCDKNGNVLSEKYSVKEDIENKSFTKLSNEYQQAKERCLFEEKINMPKNIREFMNWIDYNKLNIIEDIIDYNLTLTQTAIKQIGL